MAQNTRARTGTSDLERRLQPWIDQGEYIITLVIALMAWSAGWVDLVGFVSPANPIIFGRYAPPFFAVLVAFTLGFGLWIWLIRSLKALDRMKQGIAFIQRRPWIYALTWVVFGAVIWSMFEVSYWLSLPLLESAVLALMLLFSAVVLLANPVPGVAMHAWRKVALGLIGALLLFEGALHGLAGAGALPFNNLSGLTVPYGSVYQASEGRGGGTTNRFGWYYPDFRLEPGSTRIILSGDTFVQALQAPMDAHMGLALERQLGAGTEVLAQGQLGYGSTMFINPIMHNYIWKPLQPKEIVVFFHLANDFQLADHSVDPRPRYMLGPDGVPMVVEEDFAYWHTLAHEVIAGHDPVNPIRTVLSNSLSLQLALGALGGNQPRFVPFTEQASEAQPFGPATPLFETAPSAEARQSFALAAAQIKTFATSLADKGITLRIVTIPYVPQAVLADSTWNPAYGAYDVLAPERELEAAAKEAGVPFLAMGRYMQAGGASSAQVRELFFNGGRGHLTEQGHAFFAQAIYDCFYSQAAALDASKGCVTR